MRTSLRTVRLLTIAHAALWLPNCKHAEDRPEEPSAPEIVMRSDAGKRTSRPDDAGSDLAMGPAKPADFPDGVPIYPGSTVNLGGRSKGPGKPSWSLTVTTSDSRSEAAARYPGLLRGFEKVTELDLGDSTLSSWRSAAYDMTLMIGTGADARTRVTVNVASR
jgi:hypothetical protein